MPKRNYGFEKRQKELSKQRKKEDKLQRKQERSEARREEGERDSGVPPESPTELPGP